MPFATSASQAMEVQGLEWIILLVILAVLFLFVPKRIPELMRSLGRGMGEFKRGQHEIERELKREMAEGQVDTDRQAFEAQVVTAAKELGVEVEGRGQKEIKVEIAKRVDLVPRDRLVAAAKSLGVVVEGVDPQRLKESVVRKLGV